MCPSSSSTPRAADRPCSRSTSPEDPTARNSSSTRTDAQLIHRIRARGASNRVRGWVLRPTDHSPRGKRPPPAIVGPAPSARLDLEQAVAGRGVVDLERDVVDAEALGGDALEAPADLVAVVARADEDVRGERREARGDLPDVQVVDLDHSG